MSSSAWDLFRFNTSNPCKDYLLDILDSFSSLLMRSISAPTLIGSLSSLLWLILIRSPSTSACKASAYLIYLFVIISFYFFRISISSSFRNSTRYKYFMSFGWPAAEPYSLGVFSNYSSLDCILLPGSIPNSFIFNLVVSLTGFIAVIRWLLLSGFLSRVLVEMDSLAYVSLRLDTALKPLWVKFWFWLLFMYVFVESLRPIRFMKSINCEASERYSLPLDLIVWGYAFSNEYLLGTFGISRPSWNEKLWLLWLPFCGLVGTVDSNSQKRFTSCWLPMLHFSEFHHTFQTKYILATQVQYTIETSI
jgi:hypothetical protein